MNKLTVIVAIIGLVAASICWIVAQQENEMGVSVDFSKGKVEVHKK